MTGRDAGGGPLDGPLDPAYTRPLDYHVEDVPLSVLAGFRSAPGAPDFRTTRPHACLVEKGTCQGRGRTASGFAAFWGFIVATS